jgi:PKD repeat protein
MRRIAVSVLLLMSAVGYPVAMETGTSGTSNSCPGLSLVTNFLCVELEVLDNGDHHVIVEVDWGDGTAGIFDTFNGQGSFPHEYATPGTYLIEAIDYYGCGGSAPVVNTIECVVTAAPSFNLAPSISGRAVRLSTADLIERDRIAASTIDWGDGTPIELFQWGACPDTTTICTPEHIYATDGTYTVQVINEYLPDSFSCFSTVGSAVPINIGSPTPVRHRTWGKLKALYR